MGLVQRVGALCALSFAFVGCERSRGAESVGDQCLPEIIPSSPGGSGFMSDSSYVEMDSADCQGHPCIVHRLDNGSDGGLPADPTVLCDDQDPQPGCVTSAALEQSVHCSCQCDGPGSREKYCTCPTGFACRELTTQLGLPDTPSSYCVRPYSGPSSPASRP